MKIMHLATVAISHRDLLMAQLTALVDAGHEVVAVSAEGDGVSEIEAQGIRFRPLEASTRGFDIRADFQAARSFVEILRDEKPDLVHTHNPKPGIYGRIAARMVGVPRVVNTVHGLYAAPDSPLTKRAVVYGLEAVASRFSQLELVQNIEDVDLMCRTPIARTSCVRHLGNGIDLDRFRDKLDDEERQEIRDELGIDRHEVAVVSVGRLVNEKGFPELLEAADMVPSAHRFFVIGPDDPEKADALAPSARKAAEARGVIFLGRRSDLQRLLPAFDLFVLASHREGLPRAAMEAAACGLPVVATNIRGCRQVVDDGENGFLVPVRNASALAAAMDKLISDPDLRDRCGVAGRAKAERDFDENVVVDRMFAAYAELGVYSAVPVPV